MKTYFLPSWYNKNRKWYINESDWYHSKRDSRFDDTINQIRLFQQAEEKLEVIVTNYSPYLRYFLHRQDIFEVPYWSVFDHLQGFVDEPSLPRKMLTLLDFQWPKGTIPLYNSKSILMYKENQVYANIQIGSEGYIQKIEYLNEGIVEKVSIIDDRGFVSSEIVYRLGEPFYQDYLNKEGVWQVREWLQKQDNLIRVNPEAKQFELLSSCKTMQELVKKILSFKIRSIEKEDSLVVAASLTNQTLLLNQQLPQNTIYSFFRDKGDDLDQGTLEEISQKAKFIVTDTLEQEELLREKIPNHQIIYIPTFDTRLKLNLSQRVREYKVFLSIGEFLKQEVFCDVLGLLCDALCEDDSLDLILGAPFSDKQKLVTLYEEMKKWIATKQEWEEKIRLQNPFPEPQPLIVDDMEDEEEEEPLRDNCLIVSVGTEEDLIKELTYVRLIVDVGDKTDYFLQIAGISGGIPMIVTKDSPYIEHKKNGYILRKLEDIPQAFEYYLSNLVTWNKSLVYSVQKIIEHTDKRIMRRWKELVNE